MNITVVQLEYIVALDTHRHFALAAAHCFVTQPTLSMQIHKLEEELGVLLFDRSRQPVVPTELGEIIVAQARKVLQESKRIESIIQEFKGEVAGNLKLGIIPTVSSYLIPLFINKFIKKFPNLNLQIEEDFTENLLQNLKAEKLDAAILATPLHQPLFTEYPLYYEPFVVYAAKGHKAFEKKVIGPGDIVMSDLWLLQEGHCMRNQVLNICSDKQPANKIANFEFKAGNIETLKKIVEIQKGITLLPELATYDFNKHQKSMVRYFKSPEPVREISIVTHRHFVKKNLIETLSKAIINAVPEKMLHVQKKHIIQI
jgi:LysR family hydrogen peroxide-inducible transcriptional activator